MTPSQDLYRVLRRAGVRRDEARRAVPRLLAAKADIDQRYEEMVRTTARHLVAQYGYEFGSPRGGVMAHSERLRIFHAHYQRSRPEGPEPAGGPW